MYNIRRYITEKQDISYGHTNVLKLECRDVLLFLLIRYGRNDVLTDIEPIKLPSLSVCATCYATDTGQIICKKKLLF